jgi:hypothetical protein
MYWEKKNPYFVNKKLAAAEVHIKHAPFIAKSANN